MSDKRDAGLARALDDLRKLAERNERLAAKSTEPGVKDVCAGVAVGLRVAVALVERTMREEDEHGR